MRALRWFLVLPAAASAYAYVQVVVCLASFVFDDRVVCPVIASVLSAALLTYAAARTAPKFRVGVALLFVLGHWMLLNLAGTDAAFELLHAYALPNLTRGLSLAASLLAVYAIYRLPSVQPQLEVPAEEDALPEPITTRFEPELPVRAKSIDSRAWRATTVEFLREPV